VTQQKVLEDEVLARTHQRLKTREEENEHGKHRLSIAYSSPRSVLPSDRSTAASLARSARTWVPRKVWP
jgi:hypothetical protein